ncbi:ATP-binding cassette domain-containing protein [Agromyces atrinae]|uniref:ABC transporter ATP-binding protein n=1 Tax=Agromyces atrinae TaxID=592376 RepID=UPI001F5A457F|nr:ATP-binding cassette domain-containing protein [Agromyces atrinae]MCI2956283.1 ATP-binding cassette domain-containing protein [Agromyces atrinae]
MTSPSLLQLDRVSIRHDGAVRATPNEVSFDVAAGEVVLLLGPSGCGKSTLALSINGLVPHDVPAELDGTVTLAGLNTANARVGELSAHASMVFQDPDAQIVTGTLFDEVCFAPENQLQPKAVVLERAEQALRDVGLWERRSENPDKLSGGGRQRLAIACALAMNAPLLVLDEPTANLDPAGIEEVYAVLRSLAAEGGHAIVLVEHNLDAAIDIVDRVVVLGADGRLVLDGPTDEIMRGHARELLALGVWLPVSTLAALALADAGIDLDPLPLTPHELAAALDAVAELPEPTARVAAATEARPPIVRVRDLAVRRGGKRGPIVVDGVSLDIAAGDFVAIVGTNGAGKTTLLQAIAGVIPPPVGAVEIDGLDPARTDPRTLARHVGFVFQNPEHQFITHSVADELEHGLRIQGVDDAERAHRVDEMLRRFGLDELREQHPFLLSGGQKRRLSVGTALIAGAPVLALDEPTFGQDRERAAELLDMLSTLNRAGTTVLVVTHDLQLVAEHASHIVVMQDGGVVAAGETEAVLAGPAIEAAGLRVPPLARAMRSLVRHPSWNSLSRLTDLPVAVPVPASVADATDEDVA